MDHNRKRSAASSNLGPNRSVVDYETEEQLRLAMMAVEDCSPELVSMLSGIQEGQPVQKVSLGR